MARDRETSASVTVENERTGERVQFVHESPELLRMEVTWMQPGRRALRHAHPGMEEFVRRAFADDDPAQLLAEYQQEIVLALPEPSGLTSPRTVKPVDVEHRTATSDDHALCRAIHHRAYHDVVERQFGQWDEAEQDAYFDQAWQQHGHDVLVCDGSTCGYTAIEFGPETVFIHELVVDPDYQGQGVGTQVLLSTIGEARRLGLDVSLQVLHENQRAARLYERLGFNDDGTTATHRQMRLNA